MWDFDFRDDLRRLVCNRLATNWGEPSRSDRVRNVITTGGFEDMARHVIYSTSHDVEEDDEQRMLSYFLEHLEEELTDHHDLFLLALDMVNTAMALVMTSAGIPMFLAGEEFADEHDTDRRDWRHKMSDPVDWARAELPGRRELLARVRDLIRLRTTHAALHRNEVEFFGFNAPGNPGFHPTFDENGGERLFAYCRTGGRPLGTAGQVVVVANCSRQGYPVVWVDWPWGYRTSLQERGGSGAAMPFVAGSRARMPLRPFEARVFTV
jgi:hypothetical protein